MQEMAEYSCTVYHTAASFIQLSTTFLVKTVSHSVNHIYNRAADNHSTYALVHNKRSTTPSGPFSCCACSNNPIPPVPHPPFHSVLQSNPQ